MSNFACQVRQAKLETGFPLKIYNFRQGWKRPLPSNTIILCIHLTWYIFQLWFANKNVHEDTPRTNSQLKEGCTVFSDTSELHPWMLNKFPDESYTGTTETHLYTIYVFCLNHIQGFGVRDHRATKKLSNSVNTLNHIWRIAVSLCQNGNFERAIF